MIITLYQFVNELVDGTPDYRQGAADSPSRARLVINNLFEPVDNLFLSDLHSE